MGRLPTHLSADAGECLQLAFVVAGAALVLGPRAVLTPLARDKARALGVPVQKER